MDFINIYHADRSFTVKLIFMENHWQKILGTKNSTFNNL